MLVSVMKSAVLFHNFGRLIKSSHTLHWRRHLQFGKMEDAAKERSSQIRLPKSCRERDFFSSNISKPKIILYKDKWAIDVFLNWHAAREKKLL